MKILTIFLLLIINIYHTHAATIKLGDDEFGSMIVLALVALPILGIAAFITRYVLEDKGIRILDNGQAQSFREITGGEKLLISIYSVLSLGLKISLLPFVGILVLLILGFLLG